jgi:hypothetical protein
VGRTTMSSATWESLSGHTVATQRGKPMFNHEDRLYVLEKTYEAELGLSKYFRCNNGVKDCNARIIEITPHDGSAPYIKLGKESARAHDPLCMGNPQAILLKKARMELVQVAVQNSTVGVATRPIRATYDAVGHLLHRNAGVSITYNLLFLFRNQHLILRSLLSTSISRSFYCHCSITYYIYCHFSMICLSILPLFYHMLIYSATVLSIAYLFCNCSIQRLFVPPLFLSRFISRSLHWTTRSCEESLHRNAIVSVSIFLFL